MTDKILHQAVQLVIEALDMLSEDGRLNTDAWDSSGTPEALLFLKAAVAQANAPMAWQPLTPELLRQFEDEDLGLHWLILAGVPTPLVGKYEWIQGRDCRTFNTEGNGRFRASAVTYVMPFVPPPLP